MSNFDKLNERIKYEFEDELDLEWFLTHPGLWPTSLSLDDKMEAIYSVIGLTESLRELSYNDFLHTSYWNAIQERLSRCCDCECCGEGLEHLRPFRKSTYYYGKEYLPRARCDFLILCPKCYEKMEKYFTEITERVTSEIEHIVEIYQKKANK